MLPARIRGGREPRVAPSRSAPLRRRPSDPMRVLFVYPNLSTQTGFSHGLASLSACLLRGGHETRLVNLNDNLPPVPTREEILQGIADWRPGLIGFSAVSMQYPAALELARWLRSAAAGRGLALPPLIVGGVHSTMVPDVVMSDGVWDHVGVGECEEALLELVERLEAGERPDDVRNFLSFRGGRRPAEAKGAALPAELWNHNPVRPFPGLEELPEPDYELFDTQRIIDQKGGWFSLLTSRGCPYRCSYCLNHKIAERYRDDLGTSVSGTGFSRCRPADRLIREIQGVLRRYRGIETLIFDDDLFTRDVDHVLGVCRAYRESGIGLPFVVNSHVKRLDPRVARALGESGCRILKLGIESGSPRVRREILRRPMSDEDILATIEVAEGCGLHTSGFMMIGLPHETREERWQSVDLLARSGLGRFRTSLYFPFPGTDSHHMAISGGFLPEGADRGLTDFTASSCLDFGEEENLNVEKMAACMPWLVNSRLDRWREAPAAARFRPVVERVLAMDRAAWEELRPRLREVDDELSRAAAAAGELHYAIRYDPPMGVRSDWYLAEEGSPSLEEPALAAS